MQTPFVRSLHRFPLFSFPLRAFLLLCCAVVASAGCGGSKDAKDSVSGKVTLNSQPVTGQVSFVGGGVEKSSPIMPDGSYNIENPPKGEVNILVKSLGGGTPLKAPVDGGKGAGGTIGPSAGGAGGGVNPPARYSAPNELKFTVTGGKQVHNIELKP